MKLYLFILVLALIIPVSQAYSISGVSIDPSGPLVQNTSITASFQINISVSDFSTYLSTFPEGNTLQLTTNLENPTWIWWIFLNDMGHPYPKVNGKTLQITGWELSYRNRIVREEYVRVLLEGKSPVVAKTQNVVIFDILELDQNFKMIPHSEVQHTSLVVNPSDISNGVATLTEDLHSFRIEINNKTALGVDISDAEEKYQEAYKEIEEARNSPSTRYLAAMKDLTNADTLIGLGYNDLDKAWAQKAVNDAQFAKYSTDLIITDLKVNKSMGGDTRVSALINEKNIASELTQNAIKAISIGDYDEARIIAIRASKEWNKTFQDAASLKSYVENNEKYALLCTYIIFVIMVITGSSGVIIEYRRKKREQGKEDPK